MGFVNASDYLLVLAGEITDIQKVREFCGLCDLRMGLDEMRTLDKEQTDGRKTS